MTLLNVIDTSDNFPQSDDESWAHAMSRLWQFRLPGDNRTFGYLTSDTVSQMPWTSDFKIDEPTRMVYLVPEGEADIAAASAAAIDRLMKAARDASSFPKLWNWPGEKCALLGSPFPFAIDRPLAPYFGITATGSHLNVFVRGKDGSVSGVWIARRGLNKAMYAGMLDNAAAGAVRHDETPSASVVREAREELGLDASNAVPGGTISWFNIKGKSSGINAGLVEPGVQYVYDLEVSPDTVLHPAESGIEWLRLLSVQEVMDALHSQQFKPSCACVMIDFFVRHGVINVNNNTDYAEIVNRLHRRLPFSVKSPAAYLKTV